MSYFHKWTLYNLSSLLLFFVSLYSLSLPLCLRFFLFSPLCFSLLTVNSRFFFSTSSADSSTIPPSCRGIRVFLGIAKLAWYFPASSAPTPLPLSLSLSPPPILLPLRSRLATSTIRQPETLCLYFTHTKADTVSLSPPKGGLEKSSTGVTNTETTTSFRMERQRGWGWAVGKVFSCQQESVRSPTILSVIPLDIINKLGHFSAVSEDIKSVALSHKNEVIAVLLCCQRSLFETTSKHLLARNH